MEVKAHKHNKLRTEVVEIYKNNEFVSHSLSATCVSSVKFTADGQMSTKTIGKIGDRHLKAKLKLPDLEERCAIPSTKNLYKLSQQLANNEVDNQSDDNDQELQEKIIDDRRNQNNLAGPKSVRVNTANCKSNRTFNIIENKSKEMLHKTYNKGYKMRKDIPVQGVKKKLKKTHRIRYENLKFSTFSTDESFDNTPQSRENHTDNTQVIQLFDRLAQLQPEVAPRQITMSQDKKFNKLIRTIKVTSKKIDDWHSFTLLLALGTAAYLIYILCYDINIYVNEERRYQAKMRSSPIVIKCFYYLMRLLKVPIF